MVQKLVFIACLAVPSALVCWACMRLTPRKGFLRACEKVFLGIALIYLVNWALSPFQLSLSQSPLASLAAGYLGVPGAALAFVIQQLP
ncbi:MAG: pro-sigmaK processing inhibitor BofA family protein [Candidatus Limiplasma sp.]|nr:pro-sigmaK processing inhibitor BofA family protein [Candidatus Limiplasma sp.]